MTASAHAPVLGANGRSAAPGVWAWCVVVAAGLLWGRIAAGPDVGLGAAPLVGHWIVRIGPATVAGGAVAGAVVVYGPVVARRVAWPLVPLAAGAAAVLLAVSLATLDGWDRLTAPLTTRYEYEPYAATISSASSFIRGFVDAVPQLPTHVKAHPPVATLVPWSLDRLGVGGAGWFAALVIASWGVAIGAALVAARAVLDEAKARAAAPGLVLLPAVLWAATSADALFCGIGAVGVALTVVRPSDRRFGFAGGVVLGLTMLLSYGAALLFLIPAAVALHRRRLDDLVVVAAGVAAMLGVALLLGFWWLDGLSATRTAYWAGIAGRRPLPYLAIAGNPAALALAIGPAVAVGLRMHRGPLVLGALAAVAVANVSLMSAGEVERIWLPFMPWLALAAPGDDRRWLAVQAVAVVGLATVLRSSW